MNQQINLYQPIFRRERKLLSLKTVSISLLIVTVALLALYGFSWSRVNQLAHDVGSVRHRLEMQQQMVAKMSGQLSAATTPEQVQANIKRMSAQLADRTRALQMLRSGAAGGRQGFANRMEALARNGVEGLWLDRLSMHGGADAGSGLLLEGRAVDAQLLPTYLQQLANEPELSGARFDQVIIDRHRSREEAERDTSGTISNSNLAKPQADAEQSSATVRFSVSSSRMQSDATSNANVRPQGAGAASGMNMMSATQGARS